MSKRFVILHHTVADGEHWDLMLEVRDALATWQLLREPTSAIALPIRARRIDDHRRAYLDYEGPVSRDRGEVRRVDEGTCAFELFSPARVVIRLAGRRLTGRFVLEQQGEEWVLDGAR